MRAPTNNPYINIMNKSKPTRAEAEAAVRTLINWAGDDASREGLLDTPARVVDSYAEFFAGYHADPKEALSKTFAEIDGYAEMVLLSNIRFESYCEHHMVPIIGKAHVAYVPDKLVVGISKLARVVDIFSKRLQIQEKLTVQIAETINEVLSPKGVAVLIEAGHQCISTRGIHKSGTIMQTSHMTGCFKNNALQRQAFFSSIHSALPTEPY